MDGFGSHTMTPKALRLLWESSIYCICFPSHTSSELQPLDKGIFAVMKRFFKELLDAWLRKNMGVGMTKWVLLQIFFAAITKAHAPRTISQSFATCGIWPFNEHWVEMNPKLLGISKFFERPTESAEQAADIMPEEIAPAPSEEAPSEDVASFPIIPLAQLHSRYVNHVADEGPANLLDAICMAKLRLNPYVDSWGSSSIISPQVPQLV